ncbi:MAG: hypothetical protein MUF64_30130 [Polyangiaceae bacterium]|nr:hypothetical protein [Polyangiaceae bacterium]
MTLRPCARCGRHFGDELTCPHCGSSDWRAPVLPEALTPELRPVAPKYGGPPLRRAGVLAVVAAFFLGLGALARWLARR